MNVSKLPQLTLVIGGAASGKSAFAENLVLQQRKKPLYLATAQAWDFEMQQKIDLHRQSRGPDWQTIEAPLDLCPHLEAITDEHVILLDCATLWLSNHLLAAHDLRAQGAALLAALAGSAAKTVVVTNEVGQGIVPEHALGRQFRQAQGALNQALAAQAGLVVAIIAGLPLVLKGQLPEVLS